LKIKNEEFSIMHSQFSIKKHLPKNKKFCYLATVLAVENLEFMI